MFNLLLYVIGSWIIPEVNGDLPPPCSNFSMISISETQAIMFGGFQSDGVRMNDVYIVEFGKESVVMKNVFLFSMLA